MNKELNEDELKEIQKEIPVGRIGKPEDIANCVKEIIENKYINGQVITVDGGWIRE